MENKSLAHYNAEYNLIGIQGASRTMKIIIQSRPVSPEFFQFLYATTENHSRQPI